MLVKYRDGTSADDPLFDQPFEEQRFYIGRCLDMNPATQSDWPVDILDGLLAVRRHDGKKKFYQDIGRMLSPHR